MSVNFKDKYILVFDGECVLCNAWVEFVIKRDKKNKFIFTQVQSPTGTRLLESNGISAINPNTFLLLIDEKAYTASGALFKMLEEFSIFWRLLIVLKMIPEGIRDRIYYFIARNRYKWMGKKDKCFVPTESESHRFI